MRKRFLFLLLAGWLTAPSPGWTADNRALFVEKCGECHRKGGQAVPVNPADKASVVWEKYFARGRHPGDLALTISQAELGSIIQYLQNHAADSDQPAAAVIPN